MSILFLFKLTSEFIGGRITQTLYKAKDEKNLRFFKLKCDLYLLRLMCQPTTIYDVMKKLGYANSTAYYRVHQYLDQGIIDNVKTERLPSGLMKRYYKLSDVGSSLLEVVERICENYRNRY